MEFVKNLLEQQPLMALFLTIALGYLAGEINIKGFSLGVGAVLFVALAIGWFAPKSAPSPMVGTLGLAMFLYAIGIQYGKQFFIGLSSMKGLKANIMALTGVLLSGVVSVLFIRYVTAGHAMGLFAGAEVFTGNNLLVMARAAILAMARSSTFLRLPRMTMVRTHRGRGRGSGEYCWGYLIYVRCVKRV